MTGFLDLGGAGAGSSGYQIANSLRLRSSASAYLSRTPSASNRKTWTWAGWVKRGAIGSAVESALFTAGNQPANTYDTFQFVADFLRFGVIVAGVQKILVTTSAVYRDPSAHYHVVLSVDTTQATNSNGIRIWVNGVLQSLTYTAYTQNQDCTTNSTSGHRHGVLDGYGAYLDGYLADVYFIDGQALTPSSFGQTDANGVWVPKQYGGTYGTNGFYLKFNDGSSTTNLCLDRSGNGNNWTPTNVSLTAGATYDWMVDTPTQNYCVLNPLDAVSSSYRFGEFYNGNLSWRATAASNPPFVGVSSMTWPESGKFYIEATIDSISIDGVWGYLGIDGEIGASWYERQTTGAGQISGSVGTVAATQFAAGSIVQIACDCGSGRLWYGLNGTWATVSGTPDPAANTGWAHVLNASRKIGIRGRYGSSYNGASFNFGQRPFTYTPPTGFKALCSANLPAVTIANPKKHFDAKTYSGTGTTNPITGISFQPDLVWIKSRGGAVDHALMDAVRGASVGLTSNNTGADFSTTGNFSSFNSDGFTVAGTSSSFNVNTGTFISWLWKAGGAAVTNTAGSITSTVSANTAAGFSIVTYTGTGANATVGHGLGVAPKLVIVKNRSSAVDWLVWHTGIPATQFLNLNTTISVASSAAAWNNTLPTSSVFSVGTGASVNGSTNAHVAYCFAEVPGFSKFGSYTGNGSADGPFVYCGFRPRYVMVKNAGAVADWVVFDTARDTYNQSINWLRPNGSNVETASEGIDVLSNGFKLRFAAGSANGAATHIFAAFAESPFGGSNVSPATAR